MRGDFFDKIVVCPSGCWIWTGFWNNRGYGVTTVNGERVYAHRHSYERFVGPIPDGLQIDHLCRVRACVNWRHLEAVTAKENNARSESMSAKFARRTVCARGHDLTLPDAFATQGPKMASRQCRLCHNYRENQRRVEAGR